MLSSVYLATLDCYHSGAGPSAQMMPIRLTELNTMEKSDFQPRVYSKRRTISGPDFGFGFGFHNRPRGAAMHSTRVMVLDLSKWTVRHAIHLMGKCYVMTVTLLDSC